VHDPQAPNDAPLLAYRTWRVRFVCDDVSRTVRILSVISGYRSEELASSDDTYADKALHREFLAECF
jgi:hypothetical protein